MSDFDYSIHYSRFHDETESHAFAMAEWLKGLLEPHIPSDRTAKVLDVGCGYGFALRALRSLGFTDIQGVELSPQQAEHCQKAGFAVEVTNDTILWLEAHAGQFDFVVLFDVIEHVPVADQINFLRDIHN